MDSAVVEAVVNPFALTEEREQLRKEIREFALREVAPNVSRWDEASEFPEEVVKALVFGGVLEDGFWFAIDR